MAVEALYDAADDDSATGGPDLTRRIFPVVPWSSPRRAPAGIADASASPQIADAA